MSIRIVVFDLGGVMIRLAPGWEGACAAAGMAYRPYERTPAIHDAWIALEEEMGAGGMSFADYAAGVSTVLGGLYSAQDVQAIYQAIIQEEFPGIPETVHALKAAGYRTACLSNTCAVHWEDLTNPAKYPGIGALDWQHASHLFGAMKPDPLIFRRFEEATGFAPAEILFFDDNVDNIAAAESCGWTAVQILPTRPAVAQIHEEVSRYTGMELGCGLSSK